MWVRQDSNLRSQMTADLQSAPFAARDTHPKLMKYFEEIASSNNLTAYHLGFFNSLPVTSQEQNISLKITRNIHCRHSHIYRI